MTVLIWLLVSRGRSLTSMQAKLFHSSRFISRLFLFRLNSSIHACWVEDEMTCYDGWDTGIALMQLCVSYYNSEWDITLKSLRILQWKGTTAKTACFSGCLNINQRLAVSHMCFHLKHWYYFDIFFVYKKQKQRWTVSVSLFSWWQLANIFGCKNVLRI